jgi:SAM-dependent methyltransferase
VSYLLEKTKSIIRSRIIKKWGNSSTRKAIWDEEFSSGQWDFLENTTDDEIYHYLEKYSNNGSILDLGCGSGNTGNEMDVSRYDRYTGVDISEHANQRALERSVNNRRGEKNEYVCADISQYTPEGKYNIILFRESIFYIPKFRIRNVLDRYSSYLKESGVFIVRMTDRKKYASIVRLIERNYQVVDSSPTDDADIILVFR